jgi:hypothetical protein
MSETTYINHGINNLFPCLKLLTKNDAFSGKGINVFPFVLERVSIKDFIAPSAIRNVGIFLGDGSNPFRRWKIEN